MSKTLTKAITAINEPIIAYEPGSPEKESIKETFSICYC